MVCDVGGGGVMGWKEDGDKKAMELSREKRQEFLDLIRAGKTIGNAMLETKIDELNVACSIINMNIVAVNFLNSTSV